MSEASQNLSSPRLPKDSFVFGTMRLNDIGLQKSVELISLLLNSGFRRFHSSFEYESYPIFCEAISLACERTNTPLNDLLHTVKLASPHFGEEHVSKSDIIKHVARYLKDLGCDSLYQIQWMARIDLKREDLRLAVLENETEVLRETFSDLKSKNEIRYATCFPYTKAFALKSIESGIFDGMVDYLNPKETHAIEYLPALREAGMEFSALRPFAAGKCFDEGYSLADLFHFLRDNNPIEGVIAGTGSMENMRSILNHFGTDEN